MVEVVTARSYTLFGSCDTCYNSLEFGSCIQKDGLEGKHTSCVSLTEFILNPCNLHQGGRREHTLQKLSLTPTHVCSFTHT